MSTDRLARRLLLLPALLLPVTAFAEAPLPGDRVEPYQESIVLPEHEREAPRREPSFVPEGFYLVLQGLYIDRSRDDEARVPGFLPAPAETPEDGASLGESELGYQGWLNEALHAGGSIIFAQHDDEIEVAIEELYLEPRLASENWNLRIGRFFSWFGLNNREHFSDWRFADPSLAYRAMLANKLVDDGVQLRWTSSGNTRIQAGLELLRGRTYPGGEGDGSVSDAAVAFVGAEFATGNAGRLNTGLSVLNSETAARDGGAEAGYDFAGNTDLWGLHLAWDRAPQGPHGVGLELRAEYLWREEQGRLSDRASGDAARYRGRQRGWYVEGIVALSPRLSSGLRLDALSSGNRLRALDGAGDSNPAFDATRAVERDPHRFTAMLEYRPAHHSRLRLQLASDASRADGDADRQITLQYLLSFGGHDAH